MKSKKWIKFKNGYARLIILTVVSISAGLVMLIAPEKTSDWIIRVVGLIWTLEGISYGFDIWIKHLKSRSFVCDEENMKTTCNNPMSHECCNKH